MKLLNFLWLILIAITFSSCAILGGAIFGDLSTEDLKKNNTFEVYCNVEGAKIEILNKPGKIQFQPTNEKAQNGFYRSVNTLRKLRKSNTKLLIYKDNYTPDTIRIRRAPRPGLLIVDICLLTPASPLFDMLCPDFYRISRKTRTQYVNLSYSKQYLQFINRCDSVLLSSNNNELLQLKNEIFENKQSPVVLSEDFVKDISNKLFSRAFQNIQNGGLSEFSDFYKNFVVESPRLLPRLSDENFIKLESFKVDFFNKVCLELSKFEDEEGQKEFLGKISEKYGKTIVKDLFEMNSYSGTLVLYNTNVSNLLLQEWDAKNYKLGFGTKKNEKIVEINQLALSCNKEKIEMKNGKILSIDGFKNSDLILSIKHSTNKKEVFQESKQRTTLIIQIFNQGKGVSGNGSELTSDLSEVIVIFPKVLSTGGFYQELVDFIFVNGVNSKIKEWEEVYGAALSEPNDKKREELLYWLDGETSILELKGLINDEIIPELSTANEIRIKSQLALKNFQTTAFNEWQSKLNQEAESEANNSTKFSKFCFENNIGEKYELKLADVNLGKGKVVYNRYRRGMLEKSITGTWEERYVGFGDATKIACSMDGGLNMEFYLRKYMNGAWQDLQEMEGAQRTWSYCSQ